VKGVLLDVMTWEDAKLSPLTETQVFEFKDAILLAAVPFQEAMLFSAIPLIVEIFAIMPTQQSRLKVEKIQHQQLKHILQYEQYLQNQ